MYGDDLYGLVVRGLKLRQGFGALLSFAFALALTLEQNFLHGSCRGHFMFCARAHPPSGAREAPKCRHEKLPTLALRWPAVPAAAEPR